MIHQNITQSVNALEMRFCVNLRGVGADIVNFDAAYYGWLSTRSKLRNGGEWHEMVRIAASCGYE